MRVSIVINTFNRADYLKKLLHSLQYLDYPDFEVIAVNGPSTDATYKVLEENKINIKIGYCSERNLSISRNIGISMASGDIVAFIDDDAIPEPEWLNKLIKGYDSDEVAGVGGPLYDNTGYTFQVKFTRGLRLGEHLKFENQPESFYCFPGSLQFVSMTGANCSFRRDLLLKVGGFDEQYEYCFDETDVCMRLIDAGYIIKNVADAYVHHKFASSYKRKEKIVTNYFPEVKNKIYFMHKHYLPFYKEEMDLCFKNHHSFRKAIPSVSEEVRRFLNSLKDISTRHFKKQKLTKAEYDSAQESIYKGMEQGLNDAFRQDNKLIKKNTLEENRLPYKKYPLIFPGKDRLVICFLTKSCKPADGGVARFTYNLALGLAKLGHHVHIICHGSLEFNTVDYEDGIWIHSIVRGRPSTMAVPNGLSLPEKYWHDLVHGYEEVNRIKEHHGRIDIVQASINDWEGLPFLFDDYFKSRLITPVVTTLSIEKTVDERFQKAYEKDKKVRRFVDAILEVEKYILRNSPYIYAVSQAIIEKIKTTYEIVLDKNQYTRVPLGIEDKVAKDVINRNDDYIDILFVGRLQPRKGIDTLLESIPSILEKHKNVRVALVGDDTFVISNGLTFKDKFLNQFRHSDFIPRVNFVGKVSEEELLTYYSNCDIFVAPSLFESFGLVFIEAMRYSKPVIGCRIGGMQEIIEHGINGFLIEPANYSELTNALLSLIENKEMRHSFGLASRRIYDDKFTVEKMVGRSLELYRKVVKDSVIPAM